MQRILFAFVLSLFSALAIAQAQKAPAYEPQVGQEGKDVVWVPTPQALVDKMLDMAKVTAEGLRHRPRLGRRAHRHHRREARRARRSASSTTRTWSRSSKRNAEQEGVAARASFMKADLFETDFSEGDRDHHVPAARDQPEAAPEDPRPEARHAHRLQHLHHGRLESRPDRATPTAATARGAPRSCGSSPPKSPAPGRLPHGELVLKQQFQMLSGTLRTGGKTLALKGKVRGDEVSFTAGGREYRGRMNGSQLELR